MRQRDKVIRNQPIDTEVCSVLSHTGLVPGPLSLVAKPHPPCPNPNPQCHCRSSSLGLHAMRGLCVLQAVRSPALSPPGACKHTGRVERGSEVVASEPSLCSGLGTGLSREAQGPHMVCPGWCCERRTPPRCYPESHQVLLMLRVRLTLAPCHQASRWWDLAEAWMPYAWSQRASCGV